MDGKVSRASVAEKPIAKPSFPLPAVFTRSGRSELPTQPRSSAKKDERAHFFRKGTSESGSPIYGFYITRENAELGIRRD